MSEDKNKFSDENEKVVLTNDGTTSENTENTADTLHNDTPNIIHTETATNSVQQADVSKVKIVTILKERFKRNSPKFKKVLPYILVGLICFGAGMGLDRALLRNRASRILNNRGNINRMIPRNPSNGRQFNKGNNNRFN